MRNIQVDRSESNAPWSCRPKAQPRRRTAEHIAKTFEKDQGREHLPRPGVNALGKRLGDAPRARLSGQPTGSVLGVSGGVSAPARCLRCVSAVLRTAFTSVDMTIFLLCFLCSCNIRPLPEEKPLLFAPATEKYWLCNLVTGIEKKDDIQYVHDCMLVTYSPTDQGKYTNFFLSEWSELDSSFHYGMRSSGDAVWSKRGKWPLSTHIPEDSAHAAWRLYYSSKAIWLEGAIGDVEQPPLKVRGRSYSAKHFRVLNFQPNVAATEMRLFEYNTSTETAQKFARMQLAEFTEAANLIAAENAKAIYWINFGADMAGDATLLLQLDYDGQIKVLGSDYSYHPHGVRFPAVCKLVPGSDWQSPNSRKTYDLGIDVDVGWNHFIVRPMIADQEIRAGKNSFWMGAIEVVDSAKGYQAGIGNMYIFTH
jgi:hypothetical protein